MKPSYTRLAILEATSESAAVELADAIKVASVRLREAKGYLSGETYGCNQGPRFIAIHQWETEEDFLAFRNCAGCPVGKLIEAGKVEFKGGPITRV